MLKQFYEKVLPSQGVYCVTSIDTDGQAINRFATTLDELVELVEAVKDAGSNAFVALSTFSRWSRKGEYALYNRSFFVDLDVDPDNQRKYKSKDEALASLEEFLQLSKLPPPVRVDTGGGIHAYWLLDQDVPISEWKRYAEKFKGYCSDYMKIDPAVTADVSRILRCPETTNFKYNPPVPTKLLDTDFGQYSFDQFKQFLGEEQSVEEILASIEPDLPPKPDNFEYVFRDIVVKSLTGQGCKQIQDIVVNQVTTSEPMWRAGLSVAVRCVDGKEAIHIMSNKHPGYTPEKTEAKANATLEATWAYGCDRFEELNPGGCDGCPFRGQFGKSGPIQLGRKFKEAPTTDTISEEDAVRVVENPEEVPLFPTAILPYVRGVNGGVWMKQKPEEDENGVRIEQPPIKLIEDDLFPLKRMKSTIHGECLLMRHISPKDPVNEFLFPIKFAYATDKMRELLPENGVTFPPAMTKQVADYFIKWDEFLKKQKAAEIMRMQMGWTEDGSAFVTGASEISQNGNERPAAISPYIKNISRFFKPTGSYEVWRQSVDALNTPSLEFIALGLLAGFGSPLMRFTSTPGCTIVYMSPESGVGKTSSMYAALSIFCDPYYVSLADGSATDNALTGRYLAIRNICFGLDEVSNIDSEVLSRLLHRISSGRAKSRMQSSVNAEREIEMGAALIAVMTTNQSVYDKLRTVKKSPDGEIARTIEFRLEMPDAFLNDPGMSKRIIDPLNTNYGHAGPMFIKHLYEKGIDHVKAVIEKWAKEFREDYGHNSAYRFYENTIACCFAGGELAMEAGLINLDLRRIYQTVLKSMIEMRKTVFNLNGTDYKALLGEFFNRHHSGYLILNDGKVVSEPKIGSAVVGRIEIHNGVEYVAKSELLKFLSAPGLQVSLTAAEKAWKKAGLLVETDGEITKKQRLTTGWKQGMHKNAVSCYVFKNEYPEEFFNERTNTEGA